MATGEHKVIIIGSGPAGLTAGIYAARASLHPLIIEGSTPGGQLMTTTYVENWPGEKKILGPELMMRIRDQARNAGCTLRSGLVTSVDISSMPATVTLGTTTLQAPAIILATGTMHKKLNIPGEKEYWGKGVSTCAVCDGPFFQDKEIIIAGGGDTAIEEATFLSPIAKHITIVQALDKLTASPAMQARLAHTKNITVIYNAMLAAIKGDETKVTHATLVDTKTGQNTDLAADGIFIAIGLAPNNSLVKGQLELTDYGFIKTFDGTTQTSQPGVFAAGDIADWKYRQAITSAGTGCMAALDAQRYLESL